ncbi:protein shisa-4 [Pristis pectinata]|uniref:protein shisa-4 n=1 Tax=Pristis pectinata TaxID=685728 RepID=UPI00223DC6DC|nr:protein shisa-4 [Pristis pectinata]
MGMLPQPAWTRRAEWPPRTSGGELKILAARSLPPSPAGRAPPLSGTRWRAGSRGRVGGRAPWLRAPFPLLARIHVFRWGEMGLVRAGGPLLAALFVVGLVSADNDCLWYTDKQGMWHVGFDCSFFQFCCGNCTHRYCCLDPLQMITERQQKYCVTTNISPTTIAGIASAIFLFIVIIGIIICCFLCSCCYLYRRRHQLREHFTGPREVVHSYPMQPAYPTNVPPGMHAPYPTAPAYSAASPGREYHSYPMNPAYPPNMPPGPYAPHPTAPAYSAATSPPS